MRPSPSNRILILLKTEGPLLAAGVGTALGITGEAARQQLAKLGDEGLVEARAEPGAGRGRPRQLWELTPAGHATFPDGHADLVVTLIEAVRTQLGPAALDAVIAVRENQTTAQYRAALEGAADLGERVARLTALRSREGYMADCWQEPDGAWTLVENHCPICAAATACLNFCASELQTFRSVLGAQVDRREHLFAGARRCAYRIAPL